MMNKIVATATSAIGQELADLVRKSIQREIANVAPSLTPQPKWIQRLTPQPKWIQNQIALRTALILENHAQDPSDDFNCIINLILLAIVYEEFDDLVKKSAGAIYNTYQLYSILELSRQLEGIPGGKTLFQDDLKIPSENKPLPLYKMADRFFTLILLATDETILMRLEKEIEICKELEPFFRPPGYSVDVNTKSAHLETTEAKHDILLENNPDLCDKLLARAEEKNMNARRRTQFNAALNQLEQPPFF